MKTQIKALMTVLLLGGAMAAGCVSCSDDNDDIVPEEVFTNELKKYYPAAKNIQWENQGIYKVADFEEDGLEYDIWFDPAGNLVMREIDYGEDLNLVPDQDVISSFHNGDYGTWTITDVTYYKQENNHLNNEFYLLEVELGNKPEMDLIYNTSGDLIKTVRSDENPKILPGTDIR